MRNFKIKSVELRRTREEWEGKAVAWEDKNGYLYAGKVDRVDDDKTRIVRFTHVLSFDEKEWVKLSVGPTMRFPLSNKKLVVLRK